MAKLLKDRPIIPANKCITRDDISRIGERIIDRVHDGEIDALLGTEIVVGDKIRVVFSFDVEGTPSSRF